jgi:hypothetical protein
VPPLVHTPVAPLHMPMTFHIDAKGAEIGVEDKISAAIADAAPAIIAEGLKRGAANFPFQLRQTLDTHG